MPMVYVHGAGRGGSQAWPCQLDLASSSSSEAIWLDWQDAAEPTASVVKDLVASQVNALLTCADKPLDVLAHSQGAVAALLAAQDFAQPVRSMVLFEPACFSLARGLTAVEEHITVMGPVLADVRSDPEVDDIEYARRFFTALGAPVPPAETTEQVRALRRLRTVPAPWAVPIDAAVLARVPTLVITGGWLPLYEQTAEALKESGARHEVLEGHGHRPQDHPEANAVIRNFYASP
ncbi:alpha/beta fold hydrolase [uncultured Cellulomonas sp.]|uniref:alpha/beta fold hydrolase n=1 Tax=uncultured Cellulomonas sp. TaxID=189682 RepID=UPI0026161998|nr:alpha/beta fold hydrolase [uncultured Cellulomonas sp.]